MSNNSSETKNENIDNLKIEKATKDDIKQILQFLNEDFLRTEPLNVALGIKPNEATDFFEGKRKLFVITVEFRNYKCQFVNSIKLCSKKF